MNPVKYDKSNQKVVDAFTALPNDQKTSSYWGKEEVGPVKVEIKDHYIHEQGNRCSYCNQQILSDNKALWDAEHIIPRSKAPEFMFEPQNLAVSCKDCNIAKGDEEVRTNPARKSFPNKSEHYRIVHPHFDIHRDHFRWLSHICVPRTEKGVRTVQLCNLNRFAVKFLGINEFMVHPKCDELIGKLMLAQDGVEAKSCHAALGVYIEEMSKE